MATMKITWSLSQLLRKFLLFALSASLLSASTALPAFASKGGTLAPDTSFSVGYTFELAGTDYVCSGTLIAPTLIVTAAHCVQDQTGNKSSNYIFAAPGAALDAPINPTLKRPSVVQVITEPGFVLTATNEKDDIAILRLDVPLATKGFIRIATAEEVASLAEGADIQGYGFGDVFETNAPYSTFTRVYPLKWKTAQNGSSTIQITSADASACAGDSGGPITSKLASGEEVLVAIMSGAAALEGRCGTQINGVHTMRITLVHPYQTLVAEALKAAEAVAIKKPVVKRYKLTCVKGTVKKYVTGTNPKCPTGYKQKSKILITK